LLGTGLQRCRDVGACARGPGLGFAFETGVDGGEDLDGGGIVAQVAAKLGGARQSGQVAEEVAAKGDGDRRFGIERPAREPVVGPNLDLEFAGGGEMVGEDGADFGDIGAEARRG
jgi:hypothetical protein